MKPHNNKPTENNSAINNHNKIPISNTKKFPFRKYRRLHQQGKHLECLDILIEYLPTPTNKPQENTRE